MPVTRGLRFANSRAIYQKTKDAIQAGLLKANEVMAMIKKGHMKTTNRDDRSPEELFYALVA